MEDKKSSQDGDHDAEFYNKQGLELAAQEKYDEAIEKFTKATELNHGNAETYYNWGLTLYNQEKYDEAIEKFTKATTLKDEYPEAYYNWGLALEAKEKYDKAIEKFRKATDLNPEYANAYSEWGQLLYTQEKYPEAILRLTKATELNPKDADAFNDWGLALASQEEYDEAFEKFKLAIASDPNYYLAYYNWGAYLYEQKEYEEAIKKFSYAAKLNDKDADVYYNWGLALYDEGNYDKAAEKFAKAAARNNKDADVSYNWGRALAAQDKYDEAIEKFTTATNLNDKYADAYSEWGQALYNLEEYDEAIKKFDEATKLNVKDADAYYNWGLCLAAQEKYDEAIKKFSKVTDELNKKDAETYSSWGDALSNQKKYGEAIKKFAEATKWNDKDPDVYNNWGYALYNEGKYDEAIDEYRLAIACNDKYFMSYYNWGFALTGLKQYEAAIEKYRETIKTISEHGTNDDKIWATYSGHNIADLIWGQGKYTEARKEWEKTKLEYESNIEIAKSSRDADYFYYFGNMLQSILARLDDAEKAYKEGLGLKSDHVEILTGLVGLHIERKDSHIERRRIFRAYSSIASRFMKGDRESTAMPATSCYWEARANFAKAKRVLEDRLSKNVDDDVFLQLGQLFLALGSYLTTEEYAEAEKNLLTAYEKDKESSDTCASLGVLYARMEDYPAAVHYLSDAAKLDPDDLTIRSSLADALLKAGLTERAEAEYRKVLAVTPNHVESHIGLGEVYKTMGDADDDGDMYYRAIQEFNEGMRISRSDCGSKKLIGKSLAAAYYSRGYARVKLYEDSKLARDEAQINKARADFRKARNNDPENYKSMRALEKIGKRFGGPRGSQRHIEKIGPWVMFLLSLGVFAVAQLSIFRNQPIQELKSHHYVYVLLTFGSLILAVASIYLPQLLKLKVAGIELEKGAAEQITAPTRLEIIK